MVSASFDLVIEAILEQESLQMIDDLTYYFQKTYINGEKIGQDTKETTP